MKFVHDIKLGDICDKKEVINIQEELVDMRTSVIEMRWNLIMQIKV